MKKRNSLIFETLLPDDITEDEENEIGYRRQIEKNLTNNLSLVSAYYIYTGTPPHGYGTQAPKVAETIGRAYSFNKKTNRKSMEILGRQVERMQWEKEDGAFPWNEVHGNFIPSELQSMAEKFLSINYVATDSIVNKIMNNFLHENSDVLTKGRQTFCPITGGSVTAAVAYKKAYDFLHENTGMVGMGCLDWIRAIMLCFDKEELSITTNETKKTTKTEFDIETGQYKRVVKESSNTTTTKIKGKEECVKKMLELTTRFASYLKHKERGKKDRRAIASAGMFLRMFLKIIEEFHLELAKEIPGSTISIGGEEKKAKIAQSMSDTTLKSTSASMILQGTEDDTKWNECLAPQAFAVMHRAFFDPSVRNRLLIPLPNEMGKLFSKIAVVGNFFLALKEVQLGNGLTVQNENEYSRCSWDPKEAAIKLNHKTREWFDDIKNLLSEDFKFLSASPGMLMGMHNAGSTTLGLLAVNHRFDEDRCRVVTLRSSDDSMSKYLASDTESLRDCVEGNKRNLAMIGINISPDKTFFFKEGFGEYTSWYMDGKFVSQYGVETASIRPQGKNPSDDFYAIAKGTATALSTLTINPIGGAARIRLGVSGVRRIWRINRNPSKRHGISDNVLLLSDGGRNPWNCMNCHLVEIPLKERKATTVEEKEYLLRVMNPDNPFSTPIEEETSYSKEHGCLITVEIETPRNVFNYMKRSNRTLKGPVKVQQEKSERAFGEAVSIVQSADPTTMISYPRSSTGIAHHIIEAIDLHSVGMDFTDQERKIINDALGVLREKATSEVDDDEFKNNDFDYDSN